MAACRPTAPADIRRAGLESVGSWFPGAFLELDVEDHFASALVGWHAVQDFLTSVEDAYAGRPAHFVAGENEEIAADFLHVQGAMAGALGGINQCGDSGLARAGA